MRGNASSTARAPQQAADEGDEDEHMNRVVEEEEEQLQQRVSTPDSQTNICRKFSTGCKPPLHLLTSKTFSQVEF